jgi:hypothetical protein
VLGIAEAWLTVAPLKTYWQCGSTQQRIIAQAVEALERRRQVGVSDVVGDLGTQFDKGQDHHGVFGVVGHLPAPVVRRCQMRSVSLGSAGLTILDALPD